ncbi:MlaD family protein [Flavobacterium sp. TMP13]|uniref:MlaD family protein n=1 Tax=unclassified Flavobacterium TaxID=196869 RepID=UPI00076CE86C|nr:MlaD family protein [Flavobacterium sp. TAB 87]KVV15179.1 virulence factor Mce family protein [Flavobacterium sp. TAB 87]
MSKQSTYTWKLGMFVVIGLALFVATIYFIGKQQNLFGETFYIQSKFKNVSGLEVGNNVRFSGINIGTIEEIGLVNDSTVLVKMVIQGDVQKFIKTDAKATIGSEGLMGDKVLTIVPGSKSTVMIENNAVIGSLAAIEMDDLMKSVKKSVDNAGIITEELAVFSHNMNHGDGALSKLVTDKKVANSLEKTIKNIQSASKGLDENMDAAKENFLLRGYFRRKEKEEQKALEAKKDSIQDLKEAKQEKKEDRKSKK